MGNANIPQVYDQNMDRVAFLDKAKDIGYTEVNNDLWTARFTLPADDPKNQYCQPFNYVEIFDDKRRIELFRIVDEDKEREVKGFKTYLCEHVIVTLLDDVLFQFHQVGNIGVFTRESINYVLNHQATRRWRLGRCDFNHQFLYKWESENLLAALFSIPRPFIQKWHFTYDTTSYPWTVNLVRAETEIGCEIRRRKNMQGITQHKSVKNLVTRLYCLGYGEGDNQLTIASVNNGLPYLDADTIPEYGIKQSIWTDRRFEDKASLKSTGQQILEELKHPYISYTVKSIDLFKRTKQSFDEFREGKMVRVIDRHDSIDIDTRIMRVDKPDVTKADVTIVIANKDRNVAGSIAALQERARINDTYAQGSETPIIIPFNDNAEPGFPAVFEFFIPADMININLARLRVQLLPFRAFSRAVRGGGGSTQTSTSGGGSTQTSTSGGGTTTSTAAGGGTTQTTTQQAQQTPSTTQQTQQSSTTGSGGQQVVSGSVSFGNGFIGSTSSEQGHRHLLPFMGFYGNIASHAHSFTIPAHSHNVTIPAHGHNVTIPTHQHSITISNHSHNITIPNHSHNITIPDHTHQIEFGIFTGTRATSVSIRVDNNIVPITGSLDNINIIPFLRRDGGGRIARNTWHRLELIPNTLTRISASIFLTIFTNSRGGENL